jgi:hypothetical protein
VWNKRVGDTKAARYSQWIYDVSDILDNDIPGHRGRMDSWEVVGRTEKLPLLLLPIGKGTDSRRNTQVSLQLLEVRTVSAKFKAFAIASEAEVVAK